ncbi:MAG: nucleoside deaminase [Candidatus Binatia bacterium]
MTDADYMQLAIAKAREGIAAGQAPFGAAIVCDGRVVAAAHNSVWRDNDPTAHAEVNAIRQAARTLGRIGLHDAIMFTTCEPCPMCLAATHWAKIARLIHGAMIADAAAAGFSELAVSARRLASMGGSPLRIESGLLEAECRGLFHLWKETGLSKSY